MKNRKGFTLIELIILILIIGILAAVGSSIIISVVQNAAYLSKTLNMDMLAQDAVDKIIDGDNLAHGLRFSRAITSLPGTSGNTVTYVDQDGKTVVITLNTGTNTLTRTINAVADNSFLYYASASGVGFYTGRNGALFFFYDASDVATSTAANVRRIEVNLIARTGTGSFTDWQGKSEFSTSIRTSKFQ